MKTLVLLLLLSGVSYADEFSVPFKVHEEYVEKILKECGFPVVEISSKGSMTTIEMARGLTPKGLEFMSAVLDDYRVR